MQCHHTLDLQEGKWRITDRKGITDRITDRNDIGHRSKNKCREPQGTERNSVSEKETALCPGGVRRGSTLGKPIEKNGKLQDTQEPLLSKDSLTKKQTVDVIFIPLPHILFEHISH